MTQAQLLPARRETLLDSRGDALRVTWHPDERLVVLSEWRSGMCRSTFQLDPADTAKLATFLVTVLGEAATPSAPPTRPRPRIVEWLRARLSRSAWRGAGCRRR